MKSVSMLSRKICHSERCLPRASWVSARWRARSCVVVSLGTAELGDRGGESEDASAGKSSSGIEFSGDLASVNGFNRLAAGMRSTGSPG